MAFPAVLIVLVAACTHATWNLLVKRANGGLPFVWLVYAVAFVLYLPIMAVLLTVGGVHLSNVALCFILGNGVLHTLYFVLLQRGYRVGDLSLVYPVARGSAPLFASVAAFFILKETPTLTGLLGTIIVTCAIFLLACPKVRDMRRPIAFALATGGAIAAYTIWDKHAVATLLIAPLVYDFGGCAVRLAVVTPFMLHRRSEIRQTWKTHARTAIAVAALSSASYLLVLLALISAPVSVVAPVREVSVVIAACFGARMLSERSAGRRIGAAIAITVGICLIAL